jgi:hypothetical protein
MCVTLARCRGDVKAAFGERSGGGFIEERVRTVAIARPGQHDCGKQQIVRRKLTGRREVAAHDVGVRTAQQLRVRNVGNFAFATRNGMRRGSQPADVCRRRNSAPGAPSNGLRDARKIRGCELRFDLVCEYVPILLVEGMVSRRG